MKFKINLILSFLMINSIFADEVRQISFTNGQCEGTPYATYAGTLCSPESHYVVINETKVIIKSVQNKLDCNVDSESNGDMFNLNQCLLLTDSLDGSNQEDDQSFSDSSSYDPSFSYVLTYTKSRLPAMVKGYCNQIKLFDCENYQVYSFKNDSCFSNSYLTSPFLYNKQICIGDSIITYKCEECSSDSMETCVLDSSEPNNLSKCPNIKYTTIEKLVNEIKYDDGGVEEEKKSKKSVDDIAEDKIVKESFLKKVSIKKIVEETKPSYNHIIEVDKNNSSFLISNSILILTLLILSLISL
ncbi:hypothetical protein RB653_000558 [Dictyostelium firmibasis]|uniref:Uncharacterized protein n=1 Tax=Dictyostelium firmibasis TaxID=79012 RepID=A0AAN7U2X6_9MYCE